MKKEKDKKKKKERRVGERALPPKVPDAPRVAQPAPGESRGTPDDAMALEQIVGLVGGKWKIRILWALRDGTGKRYSSIKLAMPAITDMMLSQSLRDLCEHGLVQRRQFQEIPPRVEYVITPDGQRIIPALQKLIDWAKALPKTVVKGE